MRVLVDVQGALEAVLTVLPDVDLAGRAARVPVGCPRHTALSNLVDDLSALISHERTPSQSYLTSTLSSGASSAHHR